MKPRALPLVALVLGACVVACRPGAADVALDGSRDCGKGLVTLHYPKSFTTTDPDARVCIVQPDAKSGFSAALQLIVAAVPMTREITLDAATELLTAAYATKPGWKQKAVEKKKCFKDVDGVETTGTLTEQGVALDTRICTFLHAGHIVQISTTLDPTGADAVLANRLADAVELHDTAELHLEARQPAPSASASAEP